MGLWSAYFLAKLLLYALGYIDFDPWINLGFAVFTALTPRNSRQRFAKNLIAVPVGILLLYHDSYLPPAAQAIAQIQNLRAFSSAYLLELAGRFVNWKLLVGLVLMFGFYSLARRKLRMSTFVFIGIVLVIAMPHGRFWLLPSSPIPASGTAQGQPVIEEQDVRPEALNARLAKFYADQKKIQVRFARATADQSPYDILILHICSLSWDDLKTLKIAPDAFFGHFNLVMSNFSSGASYSGPAAIRLLRGTCGQTQENKLYDAAGSECLVMNGLQNVGFEPHWVMNHDGHFGNFFGDVRDRGGLSVPLEDNGSAPRAQESFDLAPVYGDYAVLSHWWATRLQNHAPRVALYYNSISLHDGNHVVGNGKTDSSYTARFARLSADIAHFMDDLRSSKRKAIVIFIAEHGAAVGGDRRQIPGLREIPTSAIAHVPVAVALVNANVAPQSPQERIDAPSSYPAVTELLSRFIADNPFDKPTVDMNTYTSALPQSDFVAENNATTVIQIGTQYMMRSPDGAWTSLD
jgi:cellulose synthase operon protein YhjU